MKDILKN